MANLNDEDKNKKESKASKKEEKKELSIEKINSAFQKFSKKQDAKVLETTQEKLVSIDFNHCTASSIYDASMTRVVNGTTVKVCSWYDNEWGFSNRMLDTCRALIAAP